MESVEVPSHNYPEPHSHFTFLTSLVLLLYDSVLTFGSERELIWKRKIRLGAILYLMARYGAIIKYGAITINYIGIPGDGALDVSDWRGT